MHGFYFAIGSVFSSCCFFLAAGGGVSAIYSSPPLPSPHLRLLLFLVVMEKVGFVSPVRRMSLGGPQKRYTVLAVVCMVLVLFSISAVQLGSLSRFSYWEQTRLRLEQTNDLTASNDTLGVSDNTQIRSLNLTWCEVPNYNCHLVRESERSRGVEANGAEAGRLQNGSADLHTTPTQHEARRG
jgi:hypothetical protein